MKQKIFLVCVMVILIGLFTACQTEKKLDASDFGFLKKGMSYSEIVKKVGNPSGDLGSGLYIYAYPLSDGRSIYISFANLDHLQDARIYDPKTKESISLIAP